MSSVMTPTANKLGTIDGVFIPTTLTIIGVILFLRLGWVVGNVGFLGALLIILLAHIATVTTGLAMSSMATNVKIGAGGFYSLLSRSLGIEIGGAIGIPLYLSQALSMALYVIGFTEVVQTFMPEVDPRLISSIVVFILFALSWLGIKAAIKVQYIIAIVIVLSLVSFFMGTGDVPVSNFIAHSNSDVSFWAIFAIFFPAVTGISAGAAMSGDLKDPRKNLPIGILTAIGIGLLVYIATAFWLAKQGTAEELIANTFIMKNIASYQFLIVAGVIGATLSSALGSIMAAPRILMALGEDRILPLSRIWEKRSKNGEPRYALILTAVIAEVSVLLGDLNTIAPLLTMFFLITYGMINISVFIEKSIGITSFRPTFNIPLFIPLIGGIWCIFVMFLIKPVFATIAILIIIGVYFIQIKRELSAPWGDVRAALFNAIAEWAAQTSKKMKYSAKSWKPNLIIPVENPKTWLSIIGFIKDIVFPKGSLRLFSIKITDPNISNDLSLKKDEIKNQLDALVQYIRKDGIFTSTSVIEANDFLDSVNVILQFNKDMYFSPNIIFLTMSFETSKNSQLEGLMTISMQQKLGIIVLALHPKTGFGRKKVVNLWLRDQSPNINLAILMAVEISSVWGNVRLLRVTNDENQIESELLDLQNIVEETRLPSMTETKVLTGSFEEALKNAPLADLNIFGLSSVINIDSMHNIVDKLETTCLFAMDSGQECTKC